MTDRLVYGRIDGLQDRIQKLERTVAAVVVATGVTLPDELALEPPADPIADEVAVLLRAGKRTQAIKVAVDRLGLTLIDASAYVGEVESTL
jgi:hypothetical protein